MGWETELVEPIDLSAKRKPTEKQEEQVARAIHEGRLPVAYTTEGKTKKQVADDLADVGIGIHYDEFKERMGHNIKGKKKTKQAVL